MLVRCIVVVYLWMLGIPAQAIDIRVNETKSGYTLEISGSIKKGDFETLTGIYKGRGGFPVSTRISSTDGDVAEAMRLGELYREAHLSAIAVNECDSACLLWLLGAASRTNTTQVSPNFDGVAAEGELEKYLAKMDVPPKTVKTLLKGVDVGKPQYDSGWFSREIGERPQSYGDWLVQQCGEPTEQERADHRKIQSAGFLEVLRQMQVSNPDRKDLAPIIARYEEISLEASHFPEAYRQSLLQKWLGIRQCQQEAVRLDQERVITALRKDTTTR